MILCFSRWNRLRQVAFKLSPERGEPAMGQWVGQRNQQGQRPEEGISWFRSPVCGQGLWQQVGLGERGDR